MRSWETLVRRLRRKSHSGNDPAPPHQKHTGRHTQHHQLISADAIGWQACGGQERAAEEAKRNEHVAEAQKRAQARSTTPRGGQSSAGTTGTTGTTAACTVGNRAGSERPGRSGRAEVWEGAEGKCDVASRSRTLHAKPPSAGATDACAGRMCHDDG